MEFCRLDQTFRAGEAFGEHHGIPDRAARNVGGHDQATTPPPPQACEPVAGGAAEHAPPGAQAHGKKKKRDPNYDVMGCV